ncbi:MAG TPA: DUF3305 domain-containing protein [Usitatibacter sp.]|nr:DUF3305 domain-containing protein [Usitatibacter sp.]
MIERPTRKLAVILEREAVESRWESHRWQLLGVVPDVGGEARTILETPELLRRLHPGFEVTLFADEAEGYYLNVSSDAPSVFVSIRNDEGAVDPYPFQATLSYNEAARWMDGGEKVDRALAWPELIVWMGEWVEANYRPEPRKRRKPRSFEGKEGRLREKGTS